MASASSTEDEINAIIQLVSNLTVSEAADLRSFIYQTVHRVASGPFPEAFAAQISLFNSFMCLRETLQSHSWYHSVLTERIMALGYQLMDFDLNDKIFLHTIEECQNVINTLQTLLLFKKNCSVNQHNLSFLGADRHVIVKSIRDIIAAQMLATTGGTDDPILIMSTLARMRSLLRREPDDDVDGLADEVDVLIKEYSSGIVKGLKTHELSVKGKVSMVYPFCHSRCSLIAPGT